jgi:D-inositol-3-phosphate glycosyltransferase
MKKRIAFISDHASPLAMPGSVDSGGQNVYVAELCRKLGKMGYQVDVFTRKDQAEQPDIQHLCFNVRVINVQAGPATFIEKEQLLPFMDQFTESVLAFMQEQGIRYDLVHANFFMSALVAQQIRAVTGIPFTVTFHALGLVRKVHQKEADRFPEARIQIERMAVQEADTLIAECPQDRDDLVEHYGADPAKIRVIPCGFSAAEFAPVDKAEARRKIGIAATDKVILQLGRMVPRKGVDNVIRSLSKIQTRQKVKLLIVGGDAERPEDIQSPEMQRLVNIAQAEGVLDQVIFAGRKDRQQLRYYYAAADIFITTPWYEPFGITPLEAMACGTPVIGSDVGGIKYSVVDGQTGFLVPPKDPQALAEKISLLFNNEPLLKQMGINCLKRVNAYFTWEKIASMVHLLYKRMAVQPAPSYYSKATHTIKSNLEQLEHFLIRPLQPQVNIKPAYE